MEIEADVSYANYHIYLDYLVYKRMVIKHRIYSNDDDNKEIPLKLHSNPLKSLKGHDKMTLKVARRILTTPSTFAKNSERARKRQAKKGAVAKKPKIARIAPDTEELDDDDLMGEPLSEFLKTRPESIKTQGEYPL